MMQLMEERQQHEAAIAEYKQVQHGVKVLHDHTMLTSSCDCQVFQQLDEGHQKQQEELSQELLEVKVNVVKCDSRCVVPLIKSLCMQAKLGSGADEEDTANHSTLVSSEHRLRNLELELAQTKLALVESQCKNQELEHKVSELSSGQKFNWPFGNKKKQM